MARSIEAYFPVDLRSWITTGRSAKTRDTEPDDLGGVLAAILEMLVSQTDVGSAMVLLTDDDDDHLVVRAQHGIRTVRGEIAIVRLEAGLTDFLLDSRLTIVEHPIQADVRLAPLLSACLELEYPVAVCPISSNNQIAGVLIVEIENAPAGSFTQDGSSRLLLNQIVAGIRKACSAERTRWQLNQLAAVSYLYRAVRGASNFEQMLVRIAQEVVRLVDVEFSLLWLYDPRSNELVLHRVGGGEKALLNRLPVTMPERSVAARVFRSGKPFMSNDPYKDPLCLYSFTQALGTRTSMMVPLDAHGQRIGLLSVINKRSKPFSHRDLGFLCMLAPHVATMIQVAKVLDSERGEPKMLGVADRDEPEQLKRSVALQHELTHLTVSGQGIESIVAALGRRFASPIAVEDRYGNLIARFAPDNTLAPDYWWAVAEYHGKEATRCAGSRAQSMACKLGHAHRSVRIPVFSEAGLDCSCLVMPIAFGRDTLGYLSVLELDARLDESDILAIEHSAAVIGLHMMKEEAAAQGRRALRSDFVTQVVTEAANLGEAVLLKRATYLGIEVPLPGAVMVVSAANADGSVHPLEPHVLDAVERAATRDGLRLIGTRLEAGIVVLAATISESSSVAGFELRRIAERVQCYVSQRSSRILPSVGIGGLCRSLLECPRSFRQARIALEAAKGPKSAARIRRIEDLDVYSALFGSQRTDEFLAFAQETLAALLDYDRCHGPQLIDTLSHYLLNDGHLDRTAASLYIHKSTLRYRLSRIKEILRSDLSSFEEKFRLQLALKMLHALEPD